jgi:hypothetical protein
MKVIVAILCAIVSIATASAIDSALLVKMACASISQSIEVASANREAKLKLALMLVRESVCEGAKK